MAADDVDTIVLVVNNADEPPFASLISTKPDHKILARIDFPSAKKRPRAAARTKSPSIRSPSVSISRRAACRAVPCSEPSTPRQ